MSREWLLDEEKGFALFFRQRCGSTTASRWFFENKGYNLEGMSIAAFREEWFETRRRELERALAEHYDELLKVAIIRDPLDRAVSSYLIVVNNPNEYQWHEIADRAKKSKLDLSFRDFVELLKTEDLDACNIHWRRQSALPCFPRGVDMLVRLEELDPFLLEFNKRLGFDRPPSRNSVTVASEAVDEALSGFYGDVPYRELRTFEVDGHFERFPSYRHFYDEEMIGDVRRLYAEDFSLYEAAGRAQSLPVGKPRPTPDYTEQKVFEGPHFSILASNKSFSIADGSGRIIMSSLTLIVETCVTYSSRSSLGPGEDRLFLDRVDGLRYGDQIEINYPILGHSSNPDGPIRVRVREVDETGRSIRFHPPYPTNRQKTEYAVFAARFPLRGRFSPCMVETERIGDGLRLIATYEGTSPAVELVVVAGGSSPELSLTARTSFAQPTEIYRLGFELSPRLPTRRLFLKNRKIQRTITEDEVWLWREGAEFADDRATILSIHNAELAMVEGAHLLQGTEEVPHPGGHLREQHGFVPNLEHGPTAHFMPEGKYTSTVEGPGPHSFWIDLVRPIEASGFEIVVNNLDVRPDTLHLTLYRGEQSVVDVTIDKQEFEGVKLRRLLSAPVRFDSYQIEVCTPSGRRRFAMRSFKFLSRKAGSWPHLRLWLEHLSAQRYRRYLVDETPKDATPFLFEELSAPRFTAGGGESYQFKVFVSQAPLTVPRLMLTPHGYRSTHIWTEHADNTHIRSHRAVYLGREDIVEPDAAVGGFLFHGHPVTKSIFYDNPTHMLNPQSEQGTIVNEFGEVLSYRQSEEFRTLLDELHRRGCEICMHSPYPDVNVREDVVDSLREIAARYGSPTWIDHSQTQCLTAISTNGLVEGTPHYIADVCKDNGVRFFWHWASEDYRGLSRWNINLLHSLHGPRTITPLYWRNRTAIGDDVISWATGADNLYKYHTGSIARLVNEWGISILHHYYTYLAESDYDYRFYYRDIEGRLIIHPKFDEVLAYMAKLRDDGLLHLGTVGEMIQYWLDLEKVELSIAEPGRFSLHNHCGHEIKGFSLVCDAPLSWVPPPEGEAGFAPELRARSLPTGDWLITFDFPADGTVTFADGSEAADGPESPGAGSGSRSLKEPKPWAVPFFSPGLKRNRRSIVASLVTWAQRSRRSC